MCIRDRAYAERGLMQQAALELTVLGLGLVLGLSLIHICKILDDNQALMVSLGFRGTPGIVVRDDTGAIKKYNGMPQAAKLAEVFGPR